MFMEYEATTVTKSARIETCRTCLLTQLIKQAARDISASPSSLNRPLECTGKAQR